MSLLLFRDEVVTIHENIKLIIGEDTPFSPNLYFLGDPFPLYGLFTSDADGIQTALMLGRKIPVGEWKLQICPQ